MIDREIFYLSKSACLIRMKKEDVSVREDAISAWDAKELMQVT